VVPVSGPAIRILSGGMAPSQARPGEVVQLRLAYELTGLAPEATVTLTDERVIAFDGRSSQLKPTRVERGNGRWSYRGIIRVPETWQPGEYTITCRLSFDKGADEITVPLTVQAE